MINLKDYSPSGSDWTPALNAAVEDSLIRNGDEIKIPVGVYNFRSQLAPFGHGVRLIGEGSVGSNEKDGTTLVHDYDDDFLVWDGHIPYRGTGGGIDNIRLSRGEKRKGFSAITLTGTQAHQRCGFWVASRLLLYGANYYGTWDIGLNVNGDKIAKVDPPGIRNTWLNSCVFTACDQYTIQLSNTVQFMHFGTMCFQSTGKKADISIKNSNQIHGAACIIYGKVIVSGLIPQSSFTGYIQK